MVFIKIYESLRGLMSAKLKNEKIIYKTKVLTAGTSIQALELKKYMELNNTKYN